MSIRKEKIKTKRGYRFQYYLVCDECKTELSCDNRGTYQTLVDHGWASINVWIPDAKGAPIETLIYCVDCMIRPPDIGLDV